MNPAEDHILFDFALTSVLSTGEVRLQSADPKDPPVIDPRYLTHPFDQRAAIEGFRELLEFVESPAFAKDTVEVIPQMESKSDTEILVRPLASTTPCPTWIFEYVNALKPQDWLRENFTSMWHMTGTCKMGKPGDPTACVDTGFRVLGLKNLSVVDMSVVPLLTT